MSDLNKEIQGALYKAIEPLIEREDIACCATVAVGMDGNVYMQVGSRLPLEHSREAYIAMLELALGQIRDGKPLEKSMKAFGI